MLCIDAADLTPPTSHYAAVGNVRLHWLDWGNEDAPPVVFIHGGGMSAHTFDLVCLILRRHYHCIAIDLRGHGDSSWSPGYKYGLEDFGSDLDLVIRTLGFYDLRLVGMSLGALVALQYLGTVSQFIQALVLVDSAPDVPYSSTAHIIQRLKSMPPSFDSLQTYRETFIRPHLSREATLLRSAHETYLRRSPDGTWEWKFDRKYLNVDLEEFSRRRQELWSVIDAVEVPALVVRGAHSKVLSPSAARNLALRLHRGARAEVKDAFHAVQEDNPVDFARILMRFFEMIDDVGSPRLA